MRTEKDNRFIVDVFVVLALFALFALSAALLIALGASVYRRSVRAMEDNYELRTAYAYVTEKVRRGEAEGGARVSVFQDSTGRRFDAIVIREIIDGDPYVTYLYEYEGALYELFTSDGNVLPASAGQRILALGEDGFRFEEVSERLIRVTLYCADGKTRYLYLGTRTTEDAS